MQLDDLGVLAESTHRVLTYCCGLYVPCACSWMIWAYWLSPFAWALRAFSINEMMTPKWNDVPFPGQPDLPLGEGALLQLGFFTGTRFDPWHAHTHTHTHTQASCPLRCYPHAILAYTTMDCKARAVTVRKHACTLSYAWAQQCVFVCVPHRAVLDLV